MSKHLQSYPWPGSAEPTDQHADAAPASTGNRRLRRVRQLIVRSSARAIAVIGLITAGLAIAGQNAPVGAQAEGVEAGQAQRSQNIGALPEANVNARIARRVQGQRVWRSDALDRTADDDVDDTPALSRDPAVIEEGRKLYQEGVRPNGQPLVGRRLDGQIQIHGAAAACVLCHRRSALGAVEGANQIPPISGRYLFDQDTRALVNMSLRTRKSFNQRHEPYSLTTLAHALRRGHAVDGRELDALMPRYDLDDREVLALASYLRKVSNSWAPGVEARVLHFATVITPDADPERRRIFVDTLSEVFKQKNGNIITGQRTMSSAAEMALQTDRRWELHLWELRGDASTWASQLDALYAQQPVFALVSGLGQSTWQPVHQFCEKRAVPCWFPSVPVVPGDSESDFYSLYFSRGVRLEAEVLARSWMDRPADKLPAAGVGPGARPRTVLQVYSATTVHEAAVAPLADELKEHGIEGQVLELLPGPAGAQALQAAMARMRPEDALVLWLDRADLDRLSGLPVPQARVYLSGSLAAAERVRLSAPWREQAVLVYPYQLPHLRQRGLTYFKEWLRIRNVPLEDEVLQSEVYFSLSYLNDTVVDMLDNLHRDYLIERGESMLSQRELAKAEDEARELSLPKSHLANVNATPTRNIGSRPVVPRAVPRPATPAWSMPSMASATGEFRAPADGVPFSVKAQAKPSPPMAAEAAKDPGANSKLTGAPESTNVYPRLSLAQFQRHASKGAYLVRLNPQAPGGLDMLKDWRVP